MEPRGEFAQAELVDPGSSQFDRKRNPVEAPADFRDDRYIGVQRPEPIPRGTMKKAYLDDDVVSVIAKDDNGAESAALDLLLAAYRERKVDLVTSAVTLKELESYQGPQRPAIKRIFGFLKEVPNACIPMIQNNPLYDDLLKRGLEAIDAWHVFIAVKNGCQAFLTCDRLIHHYSASIRQICGLVVQKPSDFVASEGW